MTVATAPMTVPARPPRADRSTPSARNRPAIVTVMTPEPSQVSETSPPPQGFNLTVVPVLIGFSLATIVLVATGPHPLPPASKVAILLSDCIRRPASSQLSTEHRPFAHIRGRKN